MRCQAWVQPLRVVFCWVASWLPGLALLTDNAALRWPVGLTHFVGPAHTDPDPVLYWFLLTHIPNHLT